MRRDKVAFTCRACGRYQQIRPADALIDPQARLVVATCPSCHAEQRIAVRDLRVLQVYADHGIPLAVPMVEAEVDAFADWLAGRDVTPATLSEGALS